MKNGQSRILAD